MAKRRTLARTLQEELVSRDITQQQLADELGVSRTTVHDWLAGARPTDETYRRLVDHFGERLPTITTQTERLRERGRDPEHLRRLHAAGHSPEARAKAASTQRGRPKRKAGPTDRRRDAGPRLGQLARSTRGRALQALGKYRRSHPDLGLEGLRAECARVAASVDLPPASVWAVWAPKLKQWGVRETGRRALHERYDRVLGLEAAWSGPVDARFYAWAAPQVGMLDTDGDNLRRWRVRYERSQAALLSRSDDDRVTIPAAAAISGYTRSAVWLMVNEERLAAAFERGVWWIDRTDVERLAAAPDPAEVTAAAAAKALGITRKSVSRLVKRERLVGRLVKGRLVVDGESLATLASSERNAARRFVAAR